ncbi:hypothetical protein ACLOJK_020641, partial [Asimina triloba]
MDVSTWQYHSRPRSVLKSSNAMVVIRIDYLVLWMGSHPIPAVLIDVAEFQPLAASLVMLCGSHVCGARHPDSLISPCLRCRNLVAHAE